MKKLLLICSCFACLSFLHAQVLYGTTSGGGVNGKGTICKFVSGANTLSAAFTFDYPDGTNPVYTNFVQVSNGKLYGMTSSGGSDGVGVIFFFDPGTSNYTVVKNFDFTNGASPQGSLIMASNGKMYGMTYTGGTNNRGVIFSFDPGTSNYTVVKNFDIVTNGAAPPGSLIQASDGKLYGMANGGSSDNGVIFSFDPATSTYVKLKDFDGTNGANPNGSLVQASNGKLIRHD